MKQLLCFINFIGWAFILGAQSIPPKNLWLGTKTTYVPLQATYTPAPNGFKPVFINYIGRHGARHQTKAGADVAVLNMLLLAETHDALTTKGLELKEKVKTLIGIEKRDYGNITLCGADEQTGIATRMCNQYAPVFNGKGIDITTTEEVRTQQSCKAFLKGLTNYDANKITIKTPADSDNYALRFYDISPAYLKYKDDGDWQAQIALLEKAENVTILYKKVAAQFFIASFLDSLMASQITVTSKKGKTSFYTAESLVNDLNALYAISFSLNKELAIKQLPDSAIDFSIYFTQQQLDELDYLNGADDYLKKGPGICTNCVQIMDAVPLLVNFINTTDSFISNNNKDAVLRFAHAETISPFAALLGIVGAAEPVNNIIDYRKVWQADKIIPLSANIQWILFKKGDVFLIKILLNEKESCLPLPAIDGCFYDWKTLKTFYLRKLDKMHVSLKDNMHQYLFNLK